MFWGHVLSSIGTLKILAYMHVLIKIRLIPLKSNISIPRETRPRQLEHFTQRHHNKQEIASPAKDKNTEKETEEIKKAVRQGERKKKCLCPKTSVSKH